MKKLLLLVVMLFGISCLGFGADNSLKMFKKMVK